MLFDAALSYVSNKFKASLPSPLLLSSMQQQQQQQQPRVSGGGLTFGVWRGPQGDKAAMDDALNTILPAIRFPHISADFLATVRPNQSPSSFCSLRSYERQPIACLLRDTHAL